MTGPVFVDLFSGAGGLSWGLEAAGWRGKLALDYWPDAIKTYRRNFVGRGHKTRCVTVEDVDVKYLAKVLDGTPDWVVGGPPCQGFSTVGKRLWDDDRNDLFTHFMRIVRIVKPRNFLIENVLGLKDMGAEGAVRELFEGSGYRISFHVLRAADYGVPQLRRRVVFVGSREGLYFRRPEPTHREGDYTTVWDAISDLPAVLPGETRFSYDKSPTTEYQRLLRGSARKLQGHTVSDHPRGLVEAISHIPDGGNRTSIPEHLQPSSGFHNSYSRLASWAPAVAVTSNLGKPSGTRCIHPFQHRGLTAREGARLQSFPDRFHFVGGIVSQRLQVANAVPPLLATHVGRALADPASWMEHQPDQQALPLAS